MSMRLLPVLRCQRRTQKIRKALIKDQHTCPLSLTGTGRSADARLCDQLLVIQLSYRLPFIVAVLAVATAN